MRKKEKTAPRNGPRASFETWERGHLARFGAHASCVPVASILLAVVFFSSVAALAQRRGDVAGGSIILPVPRVLRAGRKDDAAPKTTLELVTRDEDGYWYYGPLSVSKQGAITNIHVAFAPRDLERERKSFQSLFRDEPIMAEEYLGYTATLYEVEILCRSGQYRFGPALADVDARHVLGIRETSDDWRQWKSTNGTPWEAVRARVCK